MRRRRAGQQQQRQDVQPDGRGQDRTPFQPLARGLRQAQGGLVNGWTTPVTLATSGGESVAVEGRITGANP
jgi:hypothetical protein